MSTHPYYLRSSLSTCTTSASPLTPPIILSESPPAAPIPALKLNTSNTTKSTKNQRRRRKRKFSQFNSKNTSDNNNDNTDLEINTNNHNNSTESIKPPTKKLKITRSIKFTLNERPVLSRSASLSSTSSIITNRIKTPRIEHFEIPLLSKIASLRRNPFLCKYDFLNGFSIGINSVLGNATSLKEGIKILSQDLKSTRCKASISTSKDSYYIYIRNNKSVSNIIGFGVIHIDHIWRRVNIEMFAVDNQWRGNGFASMMVYLIQYKMTAYTGYDLFVCAANDAIPFWINKKYKFLLAHKNILEQHELLDEKYGQTTHLIWAGHTIQARQKLLKCFIQTM